MSPCTSSHGNPVSAAEVSKKSGHVLPHEEGEVDIVAFVQTFAEQHEIPVTTVNKITIQTMNTRDFDLIVAVSFGLFIPPKAINSVQSTVNVHPSFLPQYCGPAPIHHAWLNEDAYTGVSLQTLSPTSFDKGIIFAQSNPIEIVRHHDFRHLAHHMAHIGATILLQSLRHRTYISPSPVRTFTNESYAPIVSRYIDWETTPSNYAFRLASIYNPLTGIISRSSGTRVLVSVRKFREHSQGAKEPPGTFFLARHADTGDMLMCVVCADKKAIFVEEVKVSGKDWISSKEFVESSAERFCGDRFVPKRKEFEQHAPEEFDSSTLEQ